MWRALILFWLAYIAPALGGVRIVPAEFITTTGGDANFNCHLPTAIDDGINHLTWIINGSPLDPLNSTIAMVEFANISSGFGYLTFTNLPSSYNLTTVQCMAEHRVMDRVTFSVIARLKLQGTLAAVGSLTISLEDTNTHLNWTAPFTFIITTTGPDITYCVDVINSTSSVTLHSECGINVTVFDYPTPSNSECGGVVFTVTPENAAGRGEPNSVTYSQAFDSPEVVDVGRTVPKLSTVDNISQDHISYEINMNSLVCSAHMMLVDIHTQEELTLSQEDINTQGATVVFTSERLTLNRRYSVVITAANVNGTALSNVDELSTHDVSTASVEDDTVSLHVQYLENTRARGSLVLLMLTSSGKVDFSKSLYLALDRESSRDYTLSSPLSSAWYIFSVYDIEENGTVQGHIAYPAFSQNHFVMRNTQEFEQPATILPSSDLEVCNVTSSQDLVISVLCAPSPESLATGYLVLVQRNILDNSQVSQLHVNESSDHTHAVTVVVEEGGDYHVTVFPMYEDTGIVGNSVAYSESLSLSTETDFTGNMNAPNHIVTIGVGAGLGAVVLLVLTLGGVLLAVQCRRVKTNTGKKPASAEASRHDSPKTEAAVVYEEIGDVMDSFKYTQNILYGASTSLAQEEVTMSSSSTAMRVKVQVSGELHDQERCHDATTNNTDLPNAHEMYQINPAYGVNK